MCADCGTDADEPIHFLPIPISQHGKLPTARLGSDRADPGAGGDSPGWAPPDHPVPGVGLPPKPKPKPSAAAPPPLSDSDEEPRIEELP